MHLFTSRRKQPALICLLTLIGWAAGSLAGLTPADAADTWTDIIPGVRHLHRVTSTPWNIHVLVVDVTNPHVRVGALIKNESGDADTLGETTSGMASRHNALAAINGDYFESSGTKNHVPQGICIYDGTYLTQTGFVTNRVSWAMNGATLESFINVYGTTYPYTAPSWITNAVSGGPRFLRGGAVSIENTAGLPDAYSRQPRTAIGISQNRKTLFLATVDGRQSGFSVGMTCPEFGALLLELGAWDAINFDSGGSTTFYLNGAVRNSPSDGAERRVANAVAVWDTFNHGPNPAVTVGTGFENPPFVTGTINAQDGWSGSGTTCAVQSAEKYGGQQALQVDQGYAQKSITTSSDKVQWIDFRAKRVGGQGSGVCYFGLNSSTLFGGVGFQNGGYINYYSGNTVGGGIMKAAAPYTVGQWYKISIRVDYKNNRYNVYINGRQYAVGVLYKDAASTSGLGFIKFDETGTGSMIVDDVYVGTTRFDFPRTEPDTGTIPLNGYRSFVIKNAASASGWTVVDERNASGDPAAAGSVAVIDVNGIATATGTGSFAVRATDQDGRQDTTGRITVVPSLGVAAVRALGSGSAATLGSAVVTAAFDGFFYASQPDRAAGIRVNSSTPVLMGDLVSAIGTVQDVDGERTLAAATVLQGPAGTPLVPLGMNGREAVNGWQGLDPAGLLATVCGKVTRIEADRFYLNDGAAAGDGLPVLWAGLAPETLGELASVTGPLGASLEGGAWTPALRPRSASDIVNKTP